MINSKVAPEPSHPQNIREDATTNIPKESNQMTSTNVSDNHVAVEEMANSSNRKSSKKDQVTGSMANVTIYQVYPRRFLIAFVVCMANLVNAAMWTKFGSITPSAATYYGTTLFNINMLSLVYYAIFIPVSPFGSWSLDRFGLRKTLMFGCLLNTLGALLSWLDVFVPVEHGQKYILQMLGQVLASIGQPFIFNPVSKVTSSWFGVTERTTANSVMSLGQPLGAALVLEVAPLFVKDPNNMPHLNLFLFILTAVTSIPVIFVHDVPPTPPARSAQVQTIPWLEGTKKLVKNSQFLILMVIFSLYYGTFNVYSTLLSDYVYPEGYSESDAGRLGMVSIIVGVVGTLIIGRIADRKQAHEILLKILVILNTIAGLLFFLGCAPDRYWLLMLSSVLSGISGAPIISLTLELGVESSFPVSEGTSSGYLMAGSQLCALILVLVSNALRSSITGYLPRESTLVIFVGMLIASICVLFYRNTKNRSNLG